MATKLELLRIRGERLHGMIDEIHADEDCPETLKLYWGVYGCDHCKHLIVQMHNEVYLQMPSLLRMYANIDWAIRGYIIYPINDAYYWVWTKLTLRATEPKGNQND